MSVVSSSSVAPQVKPVYPKTTKKPRLPLGPSKDKKPKRR